MSSAIPNKLASNVVELEPGPAGHDSLEPRADQGLVDAGSNLGMPLRLHAIQSIEPNEDWEPGLVGMRAAADTVASEPDRDTLCARCSALLQQMCELEQCISAMEQREVIAWQPRLRDLAAQILLHACGGRQEVVLARPAGCGCFAEMAAAENDDSLRLQRVATCLGMELAQLGEAADAVLQMGRSGTHAHTAAGGVASRLLVSLEAEVHAVRSCITPALEQACPQECRIVRGYEVIKAAFPARFR